jgi:MFS transporter, PPP family, 3-phenylpropionic acid transporter
MTARPQPSRRDDLWTKLLGGSFPAFAAVFAALYIAYGTESPFLPAFFGERGLTASQIGFALAAGTVLRLVAAPVVGQLADRMQAARGALALFGGLAGVLSFGYLFGFGFAALLALSLLNAFATAPLAPLADALAVSAAESERTFDYGWVRAIGSGSFIVGSLISGQIVGWSGLTSIVVSSGALFVLLGVVTLWAPPLAADSRPETRSPFEGLELLRSPLFLRIILVAALVIGSHALNDTFAVIQWRKAGVPPGIVSVLWSESVASEVIVFSLLGPMAVSRLGPARCAGLAATAGVIRWAVLAQTSNIGALAAVQLLHGLTFALLHLVNMRLIAETVPRRMAASAQALYATIGLGAASALLTAASGPLYEALGSRSFWVAAVLCGLALPFVWGLRAPERTGDPPEPDGHAPVRS